MSLLHLFSPTTGRPVTPESPAVLTDGVDRWPVVAGIPYLRAGRDDLRREAVARLDAGDERGALALLLTDQDPFAPLPPPDIATITELIDAADAGCLTPREAMQALNFGPVADYFALRPSVPTFLSGLALVSQYGGGLPLIEVACGIGQLLREPARRGERVAGVDLVFSKLWLARRFVVPGAELACADVAGGAVRATAAATVLCHDAFYFFPDKPAAAAGLKALAGPGGRVLLGHVHVRGGDHGGVAGSLFTAEGYAELFPGCLAFDDAAFTAAHLTGTRAVAEHPLLLDGVEAVSLAWREWGEWSAGPPDHYADPPEGDELALNPLLEAASGRLEPHWPTPKFAAEYRAADYLGGEPVPSAEVLRHAANGNYDYPVEAGVVPRAVQLEVARLARKRVLLPKGDVI